MDKIIIKLLTVCTLFLGIWLGLSQIDWLTVLKVEETRNSTAEKLGELSWDFLKQNDPEHDEEEIILPVDSILSRLCIANSIDQEKVKLHILNKDEINAFCLPDHHIVIYSGLIKYCENEMELAGVIAHELAHAENNHVMKKLIKEIGLSVLISLATGQGSPEITIEMMKLLSSTAYDRTLEQEADKSAVDYLLSANIDPEPLANFLFRLSQKAGQLERSLSWVNTHPDSEQRAIQIIESLDGKDEKWERILTISTWNGLIENLANEKYE